MFDGQNLFDDGPSYAGGWWLHEAVERRARSRRQAVAPVVVGIDHGGVLRKRELNPFAPDSRLEPLLDWIERTLLPRARARTGFPLAQVFIGGSSLGGLAALYAHLSRPRVFAGAMSLSPAISVAPAAFFAWLADQPNPARSRLYLDTGARRGDEQIARSAIRLAGILKRRGWGPDELLWRFVKSGEHNERHWRRRTPRALNFLFG